MRLSLDAKVVTRDGEDAGHVHLAVVDPECSEVSHVVVRTRPFFGKDLVIPREMIDQVTQDGDVLRLTITKDKLDTLPEFVRDAYESAPARWTPPEGNHLPDTAYVSASKGRSVGANSLGRETDVPATASAGPGSTAGSVRIGRDAIVLDRSGEHVGLVDDVQLDAETGALRGLVIRLGGTFATLMESGERVQISVNLIDQVVESSAYQSAQSIQLTVEKDQLRSLTR